MQYLNRIINVICDLLFAPWNAESPWPSLIFGSLVVALIMVGLFHVSSNQQSLKLSRNRLIARTLELLLFRHDARVSLTACGRILAANFWYLAAFARPMAVALVPMMFLFVQFAAWFEYRPLKVGETALVEVELLQSQSVVNTPVEAAVSDGLTLDGEGVRIPQSNEVCWRIKTQQEGDGWIDITINGVTERKQCIVGEGMVKLSPRRTAADVWQQILYPVEPPIAGESPLVRIDVRYPPRELTFGETEVHWIVASILIMMVGGLAIGKLFGVSIA